MLTFKGNLPRGLAVSLLGLVLAAPVGAYSVRINGVVFDADSKPTVTVQSAGDLGIDVTITGNIDLGSVSSDTNTNTNTNTNTDTSTSTNTNTDTSTSTNTTTDTSTNFTTDPNTDTSTNTSSDKCVSDSRVSCFGVEIGPVAHPKGFETTDPVITRGKVLAIPFTIGRSDASRQQYGYVGHVAKTGASMDGLPLKIWYSKAPGGDPLSSQYCYYDNGPFDAVFRWNQNKSVRGYCRLPDSAGTIYVNYAICKSSSSDPTCRSSDAVFSSIDFKFIVFSNVQSY